MTESKKRNLKEKKHREKSPVDSDALLSFVVSLCVIDASMTHLLKMSMNSLLLKFKNDIRKLLSNVALSL